MERTEEKEMPITMNTNAASLSVQNALQQTNRAMQSSITRLSSGMRVNSAADDAAGLAVSENLKAQLGGFQQAVRNAHDGVGILQTAESAYQTVSDTLVRMRELAVQSASDGLTDTERGYLNTEFSALAGEIDCISAVTEYNGQNLLDGTAGDGSGLMTFQVGTRNSASNQITVTMADTDTAALAIGGQNISSLTDAQGAIDQVDAAINTINGRRATLGATINTLGSAIDNLAVTIENVSVSNSQIRDVDVAAESANFTKMQVLQQAGVAMLAQANATPQFALRLLG
jgi:flagellin